MGSMPGLLLATAALASTILIEFNLIDTNEDGRISSSEHEVYARVLFNQMDINVDYKLSVAEIKSSEAKFLRHVTVGSGGVSGANEPSTAEKIQRIDANGDGLISRDEHANAASAKFMEMDADHNGELNREEFTAGG